MQEIDTALETKACEKFVKATLSEKAGRAPVVALEAEFKHQITAQQVDKAILSKADVPDMEAEMQEIDAAPENEASKQCVEADLCKMTHCRTEQSQRTLHVHFCTCSLLGQEQGKLPVEAKMQEIDAALEAKASKQRVEAQMSKKADVAPVEALETELDVMDSDG